MVDGAGYTQMTRYYEAQCGCGWAWLGNGRRWPLFRLPMGYLATSANLLERNRSAEAAAIAGDAGLRPSIAICVAGCQSGPGLAGSGGNSNAINLCIH